MPASLDEKTPRSDLGSTEQSAAFPASSVTLPGDTRAKVPAADWWPQLEVLARNVLSPSQAL